MRIHQKGKVNMIYVTIKEQCSQDFIKTIFFELFVYLVFIFYILNFLIIASYFTILGLVFNHIVNDLLS